MRFKSKSEAWFGSFDWIYSDLSLWVLNFWPFFLLVHTHSTFLSFGNHKLKFESSSSSSNLFGPMKTISYLKIPEPGTPAAQFRTRIWRLLFFSFFVASPGRVWLFK